IEGEQRRFARPPLHRAGETQALLLVLEAYVAREARMHGVVDEIDLGLIGAAGTAFPLARTRRVRFPAAGLRAFFDERALGVGCREQHAEGPGFVRRAEERCDARIEVLRQIVVTLLIRGDEARSVEIQRTRGA